MTTPKNPIHDWVPLHFLIKNVYPEIHHSMWIFCTQKEQSEFSKNFKKKYSAIDGHKQAVICLFNSVKSLVGAVLSKLSKLESHAFVSMLAKIVGNELTSDEILKITTTIEDDIHSAGNLYYIHFIKSGLQVSYPYDSFMINCHLIWVLCGYLFVLKSSNDRKNLHFHYLLDLLNDNVCSFRDEPMSHTEHDLLRMAIMHDHEYNGVSFSIAIVDFMNLFKMRGDGVYKPHNPEKLAQSLLCILGYHHNRFNLEIESPFGLFRLGMPSVEFEYDPSIHTVHVLERIEGNERLDGEIVDEIDKKRTYATAVVIPQMRVESLRHLEIIKELRGGLDQDEYLRNGTTIVTTQSLIYLHKTLDSNKEEF